MYKKEKSTIFVNKRFTFGKSLVGFDKLQTTKLIRENGGNVNTFLSSTTTHLLVEDWEKLCETFTGHIVKIEFLFASVESGCCEEDQFKVTKPEIKQASSSSSLSSLSSSSFLTFSSSSVYESSFLSSSSSSSSFLLSSNKDCIFDENVNDENEVKDNNIIDNNDNLPAKKQTLAELRNQQRIEREKERKEKKEKMEKERLERKLEIEREKQRRIEEIEREKEEKKKEISDLLKPAFVFPTNDHENTDSFLPFSSSGDDDDDDDAKFYASLFGGDDDDDDDGNLNNCVNKRNDNENAEYDNYSSIDSILESFEKERMQQLENERLMRIKEMQEKKEQQQRERLLKKQQKKQEIQKNIEENVKIGKLKGKEIRNQKLEMKEELKKKKEEEKLQKEMNWIKEQERRHQEWENTKIQRKIEKKEKKQRWKELKDQIMISEENQKGKKLFFGKIDFSDILTRPLLNIIIKEYLMDKRKECFLNIIKSFGTIEEIKENWEKNYIFVVYSSVEEAEKAANELAIYKTRKMLCKEQQKQLAAVGADVTAAPLPLFYPRWPKNQHRKIEIPPSLPPKQPEAEKLDFAKPISRRGRGRGGSERGGSDGRGRGRGGSGRGGSDGRGRGRGGSGRGGSGRGGSERGGSGRGGRVRGPDPSKNYPILQL